MKMTLLLTAEIKKQGIADQIFENRSAVFNEVNLQPHRICYRLHSSEKEENPESFAQKEKYVA